MQKWNVFHKSDKHTHSDLQCHFLSCPPYSLEGSSKTKKTITGETFAWALEDLKSGRARVQLGPVEEMWPPSLLPPLFSYSHPLIILIFLRHKIHPQTCTNQKSSHFLHLCKFQPIFFSHMEVTLAQMVQGTFFKIPASGQNVPQCNVPCLSALHGGVNSFKTF